MSQITTTIERDEREITLEVEFTYHRACRGARDSLGGIRGAGPPLEPDEDEYVEIESVTDTDSSADVELTDNERDRIEQDCAESIEDARYTD